MSFFFPLIVANLRTDEVEARLQQRITRQRERLSDDRARIVELENDLARVALLARALAELCLAKGLLTQEDLLRQLEEVDFADGKADGKLEARVVMPGESKPADPDPRAAAAAKKGKMKRRKPYR